MSSAQDDTEFMLHFVQRKELIISLRQGVLDTWADLDTPASHQATATPLTGGLVMLDMEVIERTGTGTRETRWKRAFEVVYGLPFEILQQRRRSVSKRIQRVMNIRADIVTAELWAAELNRRRGQALLQLVDDILINWAEDPGCCVETGGVEDELFERVVWVYEGVQDEWFGNVEGCVDSSRSGG